MTLLAAERIKLLTTRSPWWCMGLVIAFGVGFAALTAAFATAQVPLSPASTQAGSTFGQYVIMAMAAIAITNEYRFGTIRATFAAAPNRPAVLAAKTAVVAVLAGVVGLVSAFASWATAALIGPKGDLAMSTTSDWRAVAGVGLLFLVSAVIALAVGILVRQTAGAISLLLVWALVVENLGPVLPRIGDNIGEWMPFSNAAHFVTGDDAIASGAIGVDYPFGPWGSLAYFTAISAALLVAALVVAHYRDA